MTLSAQPPATPGTQSLWRALRLLAVLKQGPHTLPALRDALQPSDHATGFSAESIALSLRLLRHVGCQIERPTRHNNHCYRLLGHPFGWHLTLPQLEALAQVRRELTEWTAVLQWDDLVEALLGQVSQFSEQIPEMGQALQLYYERARAMDYRACRPMIAVIEATIQRQQLLDLTYLSGRKQPRPYRLLPDALSFNNGALYLLGLCGDYPDRVSLRLERISQLSVVTDPESEAQRQALCYRQAHPPEIQIHIKDWQASEWVSWGLGEQVHPTAEGVRLTVVTDQTFYLRQCLLSLGTVVEVENPAWFREALAQQVAQMLALTAPEEVAHG